jgi:Cu(I)/Ag(I) efflux system membrane fusion protein
MKNIFKNPYILAGVTLIIGLAIGSSLNDNESSASTEHSHSEQSTYTCSMHPSIRQEEPGDCPICGMELVPISNIDNGNDSAILFDVAMTNQSQIEVMTVGKSVSSGAQLSLNGEIRYNAGERRNQTAHFGGRLDRVFFNSVGEYIKRGELIAEIYSPELSKAHREIIEIKQRYGMDSELMKASRERLSNLKLPDHQIEAMIQAKSAWSTFPVYSDYEGYIERFDAREGMHLKTGETFFIINEFNTVWAVFDVFEKDLNSIRVGFEINIWPSNKRHPKTEVKIDFISTQIDPSTRTAEVRATLENEGNELKPNSLIKGILVGNENTEEAILIPESAVLWTGKRSIVYVAQPNEQNGYYFTLREVGLGNKSNGHYPILDGLKTGEQIAVSGAFVIDAAAELNDRPNMMSTTSKPKISLNESDSITLLNWIEYYLEMKDYLVESDYSKAMEVAQQMNRMSLPEYPRKMDLKTAFKSLLDSPDLESIRFNFMRFSEEMIHLSSAVNWNKKLVVQYCPMANQNNGAEWLSRSSEIRNPYYGDAMLVCGEVVRKMK